MPMMLLEPMETTACGCMLVRAASQARRLASSSAAGNSPTAWADAAVDRARATRPHAAAVNFDCTLTLRTWRISTIVTDARFAGDPRQRRRDSTETLPRCQCIARL